MAKKEIYRLDLVIGVKGDGETKNKLKVTEKYAEKTEKRLKTLDKIKVSPAITIKDKASSAIDRISKKSKLLNKVMTSTARINDRATPILDRLKGKVGIFNKPVDMLINARDKASAVVSSVKAKVQNLTAASIISLNMKADPAIRAISLTRNKLGELSNNLRSVAGKSYQAIVSLKDNASHTMHSVENNFSAFAKHMLSELAVIAAVSAVVFAGFQVGSTIKTFADFEQGLSNVKAVTQATDEQMQQLKNTARELGASTAWSAVEVTQAEGLLGQAGLSVKETISALPGLLSLASAGGLDLAAATEIATGTLKAFSMGAEESAHVADVLALSASATNSNVTDLGEALKYVAPVSESLGISFEDTAAAVGLLSNANIKGGQAGTVLRQTLARLASPTKEAAGLMKKYGINAFDAQGNMKPLSSVVDELNSSLGELTSQQQADVITTIFGTESMSGVLALMNQGGESLGKLSKQLEETKDAAKKMADTRLDNLAGQFELLKGSIDDVKISLGEKLAPYTKAFIKWLDSNMPKIGDTVVDVVDKIATNAPKIIKVFKNLVPIIAGVTAALLTFKATMIGVSIITTIVPILSNIAFAFAAVTGGAATVGEAMALIMGPIGWIALGIGLLVAAGVALYQNWDTIKAKLSDLKTKFTELKTEAIDKVKDGFSNLKDKITEIKDDVIDSTIKKFDDLKKVLKDNEEQIKTVSTVLGVIFGPALIKTGLQAAITGATIAGKFIVTLVKAGVEAIIAGAKLTGSFVLSLIKVSAQAIITGAKITASLILTLIQLGVRAVTTSALMIGSFLVSLVKIAVQAAITGATITASLIGALISYAVQGWATVAVITAQTGAWVIQKSTMVAGTVATYAMAAAQWVLNAAMLANPIVLVTLLIVGLVAALVILYNTSETARVVIDAVWLSIRTTVLSCVSSIMLAFQGLIMILQGVINFVVGVFTGNWSMAMSGIKGIVSGATTFISGLWQALITLLSAPIQAVVDILDSTFKEKASGVKKIWGEIKEFLKNPIQGVVNIAQNVVSKVSSIGNKSGSSKSTTTKKPKTEHATGGIFTTPHYALFAEEPGGEAVIPLNGKRRDRAISLWQETGEKLGIGTEKRNAGNQSSYFNTGNRSKFMTKHQSTDSENEDRETSKPRFEPYNPKVDVGGNGNNVNVAVEIVNNFDGDADEDCIVEKTTEKVGKELREALRNIKK